MPQKWVSPARLERLLDSDFPSLHASRRSMPGLQSQRVDNERSSFLKFKTATPGIKNPPVMGGFLGFAETGLMSLPRSDAEKTMDAAPECDRDAGDILAIGNETYSTRGVERNINGIIKKPIIKNIYQMRPSQRRTLLTYEVEKKKAEKVRKKALGDRGRMVNLMRIRHPHGVLGMRVIPGKHTSDDVYRNRVLQEKKHAAKRVLLKQKRMIP